MAQHTQRPKKSLGQHFLVQPAIAEKIAGGLTLEGYKRVLEVGPGRGMLTRYLCRLPVDLTAVEIDDALNASLREEEEFMEVFFIHGNFLKLDLADIMGVEQFALAGNFPYMISSQIVFKMLEFKEFIPELVAMFQVEMAERIVADPGTKDYGIISVFTQLAYEGIILFKVGRRNFNPPPKVDSAILRLRRKDDHEPACDHKLLRQIVKLAFGKRRKMLRNSLKPLFSKETLEAHERFTLRPERLKPEEFVELTQMLEQERG